MQFRGQRPRLQRMQFVGTRKCNLHPNDLLDLDQVPVHVICQRWHIATVFANQRIIASCQIRQDRLSAYADDKVPLLWFRRRPGCPLNLYLNEVVHLILRRLPLRLFKIAKSPAISASFLARDHFFSWISRFLAEARAG
jgi:hypothetical protein